MVVMLLIMCKKDIFLVTLLNQMVIIVYTFMRQDQAQGIEETHETFAGFPLTY